jgi:hypothetical protein
MYLAFSLNTKDVVVYNVVIYMASQITRLAAIAVIHPLFQRGITTLLALFGKEGGSNA